MRLRRRKTRASIWLLTDIDLDVSAVVVARSSGEARTIAAARLDWTVGTNVDVVRLGVPLYPEPRLVAAGPRHPPTRPPESLWDT